jgi:hypothetical protein
VSSEPEIVDRFLRELAGATGETEEREDFREREPLHLVKREEELRTSSATPIPASRRSRHGTHVLVPVLARSLASSAIRVEEAVPTPPRRRNERIKV